MNKQTYSQKTAPKNYTNSRQNPMNSHTPHHTTSIKTYGLAQQKGQTKAPSDVWKRIQKHDREKNLIVMAQRFPSIDKWTRNPDIDNELSNKFWNNPTITYSQKTSLLKFRTGQYMGNARKQLFFGIQRFP